MIVYELKCSRDHLFEAWFRDSTAFETLARAGEVVCATCGCKKIEKAPMAPRLSKRRSGDKADVESKQAAKATRAMQELRAKIEEKFDYVGNDFAEEARKIHYRETDSRNIYGETSDREAEALCDEGISFGRIPWPARHDS